MGILRADDEYANYYNSVLALDRKVPEVQWYDKNHLVPFAEFFPSAGFCAVMAQADEPAVLGLHSRQAGAATASCGRSQSSPPASATKMDTGAHSFPSLANADSLVNVTNDAWFGHGSARHQHFQIARMRAIEAQRYMLRAANDGISAVIGPHGEVVAEAPGFQRYVLRAQVTLVSACRPMHAMGNWLVISFASVGIALGVWRARRQRRSAAG